MQSEHQRRDAQSLISQIQDLQIELRSWRLTELGVVIPGGGGGAERIYSSGEGGNKATLPGHLDEASAGDAAVASAALSGGREGSYERRKKERERGSDVNSVSQISGRKRRGKRDDDREGECTAKIDWSRRSESFRSPHVETDNQKSKERDGGSSRPSFRSARSSANPDDGDSDRIDEMASGGEDKFALPSNGKSLTAPEAGAVASLKSPWCKRQSMCPVYF